MSTQWSSLKASTFPAWFSSQMHCWTKMTNKRHFVVWRSSCPVISFCNVGFKFRNFSLQSRFNIEILNENFWVKQDDRNQGLVQELFIKRKRYRCVFLVPLMSLNFEIRPTVNHLLPLLFSISQDPDCKFLPWFRATHPIFYTSSNTTNSQQNINL